MIAIALQVILALIGDADIGVGFQSLGAEVERFVDFEESRAGEKRASNCKRVQ